MTRSSKRPPKDNAKVIADLLYGALSDLSEVESQLRIALKAARKDYKFNDHQIERITGTVGLALGAVAQEASNWRSYAQARKEN